jgi:hypothetical protein
MKIALQSETKFENSVFIKNIKIVRRDEIKWNHNFHLIKSATGLHQSSNGI